MKFDRQNPQKDKKKKSYDWNEAKFQENFCLLNIFIAKKPITFSFKCLH